jgi:hypothetical protein
MALPTIDIARNTEQQTKLSRHVAMNNKQWAKKAE